MTPVLFRKYKTHPRDVVALFPEIPGTNDPNTVQIYEHNGQHGHARYVTMIAITTPATPEEAAPLARELRLIGYDDLQPVRRETKQHRKTRKELIG